VSILDEWAEQRRPRDHELDRRIARLGFKAGAFHLSG
jgi:hypothetical protein